MTTPKVCAQCGSPLLSDGSQDPCPACLFKVVPDQSTLESAVTILPESFALSGSAPGTRLKYFGDYELHEEIARGGMGVVWKARQTSLKRNVALKMIRTGALAGPEEVERFLREAEAAANLQHPNIVAIHEVGQEDGQHFFSMDYVSGPDLGTLLNDGPLAPQRAARYLKIIAEAIQFAHQRGILHRDLKPQNVLIDAADQPRITDFGLAKFMKEDSRQTQSGAIMGTPSYMPPEQAGGRPGDIGPASDVYSLGAMLYELVTGRPPFRGATAMDTVLAVMEADPVAPRRLKPDIPHDLETICLKCLEKSPSNRYPTARAMVEELDRFLKGDPIQARPSSSLRKAVSWARRHPWILAAVQAFILVSLAFGVFYLLEENAFLRSQLADRALVRAPGAFHALLGYWRVLKSFIFIAGSGAFWILSARSRGLPLKDAFHPAMKYLPPQPLENRIRTFALAAGMTLTGFGILSLVMTIEAHVWEGEPIFWNMLGIYASIFYGISMLGMVIRDYRLVHFGIPTLQANPRIRQLTADQVDSICRALRYTDWPTAIKRYREAMPDADLVEAKQAVVQLYKSLGDEQKGKVNPPK